jgi:catechol 1,2-dioxygenase
MSNERTVALFDEFIGLVRDFVARNNIGYDDYGKVMEYLITVGQSGEWPLWLDAFLESSVNTTSYGRGAWTDSAILGPYYKPDAPLLTGKPAKLPMRDNEPGRPMVFQAKVVSPDGKPVAGALLDVWHSTNDGIYSFFSPAIPDEYLLRGRIPAAKDGTAEIESIMPVPYEIPKDGPTGYLMNDVLGRHSWRPAHLHFKITADGFRPLITQLYFQDDPYLDSDSCGAVKDTLVLEVGKIDRHGESAALLEFTFVLQPEH